MPDHRSLWRSGGTGDGLRGDATRATRLSSRSARVDSLSHLCLVLPDSVTEWAGRIRGRSGRRSHCDCDGEPYTPFMPCVSFCLTLLSRAASVQRLMIQARRALQALRR